MYIDTLNWIDYDIDCFRYFQFFPKLHITPERLEFTNKDYILLFLHSPTNNSSVLTYDYTQQLLNSFKESGLDLDIVIVGHPKINLNYTVSSPKIKVYNPKDYKEIISLVYNAKSFLTIDSGYKYIAYAAGVPCLTFSEFSPAPHQTYPYRYIRSLPYPQLQIPLNYNPEYVSNLIKLFLIKKSAIYLPQAGIDIDNIIAKRNITKTFYKI